MSDLSAGERIRHIRTTLGLTQIAFGELLGVSNVTVNRWEKNNARPQPAAMSRILQAERDGLATLQPDAAATPSTLIGRDAPLATLSAAVLPGALLTITGPAGVGKSTLAQAARSRNGPRFAGGSVVLDCAPLTSDEMLIDALARAFRIRLGAESNRIARIAATLRNRDALLIIDAAEHLIAPLRDLIATIRSEPTTLALLLTSRVSLGLPGEQIIPLGPLDPVSAQRLFVSHATSGMTVSDPDIALLCARLDHLPLAIELAAARTRMLTVRQMLDRIDRRFDVIGALATAIAGSCDLMTPAEARLFRCASVFAGPFDLAAIEAIAADPGAIASLAALIDQSMLTVESHAGTIRYRMLESIRDYGWRWTTTLGELPDLRTAHAAWYDKILATAIRDLNGPSEPAALETVDVAHDNIASALRWVLEDSQAERAVRMATAFGRFSRRRAIPTEGIDWLEQALALPDAPDQSGSLTAANELGLLAVALGRMDQAELTFHRVIARAMATNDNLEAGRAWDNLGLVHRSRGETDAARAAHQTGLDLLQPIGDARGASSCRLNLALIANLTGDLEAARTGCHEALALLGGSDDLWAVASILSNLGEIAGRQGRSSEAADYYERVIEIYRRLEDHDRLAVVAANTAEMRLVRGELRQAEVLIEQAIAQFRTESNLVQLAPSLYLQAAIQSALGQTRTALQTFRASITLSHEQHNAFDVAYCLEAIARIHLLAGDPDLALRLWSGMETIRAREGVPEYPLLSYQETKRQLRERFGDHTAHPEYLRGATMSIDQLVTEATHLGTVADGQSIAIYRVLDRPPTTRPTDLAPTPRQQEILLLMAAGRTNREIAAELTISPRTVERHISQIFGLLGADRRSSAIAIAAALGLLDQ